MTRGFAAQMSKSTGAKDAYLQPGGPGGLPILWGSSPSCGERGKAHWMAGRGVRVGRMGGGLDHLPIDQSQIRGWVAVPARNRPAERRIHARTVSVSCGADTCREVSPLTALSQDLPVQRFAVRLTTGAAGLEP